MTKVGYKAMVALALAVMMSLVAVSAVPAGDQGNTRYIDNSGNGLTYYGPDNVFIINESGRYLLNESLTRGIKIIADDVTLDGNGYNLTNFKTYGVRAQDCSGVTIRDMYIFNCKAAGIALGNATDCMVEKNCVTGCQWGINLWGGSCDNKIINNDVCFNTKWGIMLAEAGAEPGETGSEGNKIHANTALNNTIGDISADEELNDVSGNHVTPEE